MLGHQPGSQSNMAAVEVDMVSGIPVVDFTAFSLKHITRPSTNSEEVHLLARKIYHAFSTVGFVYLVNHGISESEVGSIIWNYVVVRAIELM